jgi:hypothetical protein
MLKDFMPVSYLLCLVLCLITPVVAQDKSFIGGGVSVIRSSNYDPSPAQAKDGGK